MNCRLSRGCNPRLPRSLSRRFRHLSRWNTSTFLWVARVRSVLPHVAVRPFREKSTYLTQIMLGPYMAQIWSRITKNYGGTKPPNCTVQYGLCSNRITSFPPKAGKEKRDSIVRAYSIVREVKVQLFERRKKVWQKKAVTERPPAPPTALDQRAAQTLPQRGERGREFCIDNLLVRINFIMEMIWWTVSRHGILNSVFQVALHLPS